MADHRSIQHMLRNPRLLMEYQRSGHLPQLPKPASPLITLLESLYPREREQVIGLTIGASVGYSGSRQFHTAGQAFNWLKPSNAGAHIPSMSWCVRGFSRQLTIDDLVGIARVPTLVRENWWMRNRHLAHLAAKTEPAQAD